MPFSARIPPYSSMVQPQKMKLGVKHNWAKLPVLVFLSRAAKPLYLIMLGDLSS
jgi:hypothetical protein